MTTAQLVDTALDREDARRDRERGFYYEEHRSGNHGRALNHSPAELDADRDDIRRGAFTDTPAYPLRAIGGAR